MHSTHATKSLYFKRLQCYSFFRFLEVADGVKQIEHEHELMAGILVMGQIEDVNFKRITVR